MVDSTIAGNILRQLGGQRFIAMTGARNLVAHERALSFGLQANLTKQKANRVQITLDADDTYTVEVGKVNMRKLDYSVLATVHGVYADSLRKVFTNLTGLDTHL